MGRLSTHVLDTTSGRPAAGVVIELHRLAEGDRWQLVRRTETNADGRTDAPLLSASDFSIGTYMLSFHIGDYFRRQAVPTAEPPFLDIVPLRFTISEPDGHYHVPLLATPWSYATYRGS
ncbi:MAG: hydroxyisourate hydrolase [Hyphomonadaceae bacterium]|jgi:hydroxyisourate hydrolase|nr:hydroxyisourate hydrolase [Hyphomonadaceae bacterium]